MKDNKNVVGSDIKPSEVAEDKKSEFQKMVRDTISANRKSLPKFKAKPRRIVDKYDRDEISYRLDHFASHSAARGIDPTVQVILDWLYSEKEFNEKDDFVTIERLIEMLKTGKATPLLILEVLEYALAVEKSAIEVYNDLHFLSDEVESVGNLKKALELRLETENSRDRNGDGVGKIIDTLFSKK